MPLLFKVLSNGGFIYSYFEGGSYLSLHKSERFEAPTQIDFSASYQVPCHVDNIQKNLTLLMPIDTNSFSSFGGHFTYLDEIYK